MKCLLYLEIDILIFHRPSFSPGECSGASSRKIGGHCNNLIMGMSESHGNNSQQFADVTHETQDAAARGGKLDIQQIEIINENKQLLFDGIGDRYLKVSGGSMFFSHSHDNILIYLTLKVFDLQKEVVRQAGCSLQHPPISLRHCTGGGTADITTASVWLPGLAKGLGCHATLFTPGGGSWHQWHTHCHTLPQLPHSAMLPPHCHNGITHAKQSSGSGP